MLFDIKENVARISCLQFEQSLVVYTFVTPFFIL